MARFNESYYSEKYYGQYNGWIAVLVGGFCIWAFIAWSDHSAVQRPIVEAEKKLEVEKKYGNKYDVKIAEENLREARAYVNSGQNARDLAARDAEVNRGSRTMGDVFWVCITAVGVLVFGWRTVRGVASPFEVLLALGSTAGAVIMALSIGVGAFIMLFVAGLLLVLMARTLGDDVINRARHVRDTYDEEFDVNERRAQRRQAGEGRRRLPVSSEAQAAFNKKFKEMEDAKKASQEGGTA